MSIFKKRRIMRIIYSLNTDVKSDSDYYKGNNLENNFKFYELSMKLSRQYYHVTLYTDEYGSERLGEFADEVKYLKKDKDNYIWSEPKFEAISNETGDFLHVDGDLFISEPFNLPYADIYYDHTEVGLYEQYYKDNLKNFDDYRIGDVFPEWTKEYLGAFNIGIMGFRTEEIKNLYLDRYYKMKQWFYNDIPQEIRDGSQIPSMTLGEHSLSCISKSHNFISQPLSECNGYLHMYGGRKHGSMFVKFVENQLKHNNYKTYLD